MDTSLHVRVLNEKLELVDIGGPGTDKKCSCGHKGALSRILRGRDDGRPLYHWYVCYECEVNKLPTTIHDAVIAGLGKDYWRVSDRPKSRPPKPGVKVIDSD